MDARQRHADAHHQNDTQLYVQSDRRQRSLKCLSIFYVATTKVLDHLQILDYCSLIEHPESSEAIAYVRKTLRELSNKEELPGQVPLFAWR